MTERTHTPSAAVQAQLDALAMPICVCLADAAGQPCFRVVPVAGERCSPCAQGWCGPGGSHGYGGAATPDTAARSALRIIVSEYGQVCENFELCTHVACRASYGAWAVADEALRGEVPGEAEQARTCAVRAVEPPVVPDAPTGSHMAAEPCLGCGRLTCFGYCARCASPNLQTAPDDRPQLAACTRCGARPTFYGVCCICDRAAGELRVATTFQTARLRDRVFGGAGE
jgi:hypothetical protein